MKNVLKRIILCLCIGMMPAFAMETVQKAGIERVELTFEQAYELMMQNNNSLKAYNEIIKQYQYQKRSALGMFSPTIRLNATYMHLSDEMALHTPITMPVYVPALNRNVMVESSVETKIQDNNVGVFGVTAVWHVFTGGKLLSNHAAARAMLEASNEKYREVKDNLTLDLVKRYYGLRMARDVVEVRKQVMEGIGQHLKNAKMLEKEGIISKSERLHAEVAYSDAKRAYDASVRDANVVEEGLKTLIKADDVDLKDVYVEPSSLLFVYNNTSIDLNEMKAHAVENNPLLMQLRAKKKALNAKYHAKMAEYSPTVSLMAYDIAAKSDLSEAIPTAGFGVTANWLVFDGLQRYHNVRAAGSERKAVDYQLLDAQYNIESLVIKQYQELMKNKEQYDSSSTSIEQAQEALRTATLAFNEGFATSLQVTDAQMMLSKVKIERLKAVYDYDVNLTDLLKTNGDTNDILEYIKSSQQEKF